VGAKLGLATGARVKERAAFVHYLRTGRYLADNGVDATLEFKFNPYHDPRNGQFTFAPGGTRSSGNEVDLEEVRSGSRAATQASVRSTSETPAARASDPVNRRFGTKPSIQTIAFRSNPRARSGGNAQSFYDPMTLQQAMPQLANAPGGSILAFTDQLLDITGPAQRLTADLTRGYTNALINQIQALEPNYRFQSLGYPTSAQGQANQINSLRMERAVAFYRVRGELRPLQIETLRFLQRSADSAYEIGLRRLKARRLRIRLSPQEALGNFVDRSVRRDLRDQYAQHGISILKGQRVRVNSREYDTSETGQTYRIPDARVGNVAFDVTLTRKTLATAQVRGYFSSDFKPDVVVIVRPTQLGAESSYLIKNPRIR
jgi:hypothetical protein